MTKQITKDKKEFYLMLSGWSIVRCPNHSIFYNSPDGGRWTTLLASAYRA
jgi:hypothetical protein